MNCNPKRNPPQRDPCSKILPRRMSPARVRTVRSGLHDALWRLLGLRTLSCKWLKRLHDEQQTLPAKIDWNEDEPTVVPRHSQRDGQDKQKQSGRQINQRFATQQDEIGRVGEPTKKSHLIAP
jgi:hypothetical protein